ncbi:radical S-adenosyl methionine domain-containing protein 1 [Borealophlyctis nickersoniae]|nr:radical S-adenosyl methionine domain-containing protein 1 [Borealophlyctis nickersoniae]
MQRALISELTHALIYPVEAAATDDSVVVAGNVRGERVGGETRMRKRVVQSVYFGGGTPSLAKPELVSSILEIVSKHCALSPDAEITLEGNPTSITSSTLRAFYSSGINRVSLGIQSLRDADLRTLGRDHSTSDAIRAIETAQEIVGNVSLDFIWGRVGQSVEDWEAELRQACAFRTPHMSLYQLTFERGTPLFTALLRNAVARPHDDTLADMYERTIAVAEESGYAQYEVSSFVLKEGGRKSRHNSGYWEGVDYIGIGPGAHGRLWGGDGASRYRTYRILHPETWMRQCEVLGHGMRRLVRIEPQESKEEAVLLGLRTFAGISADAFKRASGGQELWEFLDMTSVRQMVSAGFLQWIPNNDPARNAGPDGIQPTRRGLAVIDRVVGEIIKA